MGLADAFELGGAKAAGGRHEQAPGRAVEGDDHSVVGRAVVLERNADGEAVAVAVARLVGVVVGGPSVRAVRVEEATIELGLDQVGATAQQGGELVVQTIGDRSGVSIARSGVAGVAARAAPAIERGEHAVHPYVSSAVPEVATAGAARTGPRETR